MLGEQKDFSLVWAFHIPLVTPKTSFTSSPLKQGQRILSPSAKQESRVEGPWVLWHIPYLVLFSCVILGKWFDTLKAPSPPLSTNDIASAVQGCSKAWQQLYYFSYLLLPKQPQRKANKTFPLNNFNTIKLGNSITKRQLPSIHIRNTSLPDMKTVNHCRAYNRSLIFFSCLELCQNWSLSSESKTFLKGHLCSSILQNSSISRQTNSVIWCCRRIKIPVIS